MQGVDIAAGGDLTLGAVTGDLTIGAAVDRDVRHSSQYAPDAMADLGDATGTTGGVLPAVRIAVSPGKSPDFSTLAAP